MIVTIGTHAVGTSGSRGAQLRRLHLCFKFPIFVNLFCFYMSLDLLNKNMLCKKIRKKI